VYVISFF